MERGDDSADTPDGLSVMCVICLSSLITVTFKKPGKWKIGKKVAEKTRKRRFDDILKLSFSLVLYIRLP